MAHGFETWIPCENLDTMYDVDNVSIGADGFCFHLLPDGLHRDQLAGQRIRVCWARVIAYQISDELYREDCWHESRESAWSFYTTRDSAYLDLFRQHSGFFPEAATHFQLRGTNLIADILAEEAPTVEVTMEPDGRGPSPD